MNINKIKISGTTYNIQDENACNVVELTQAQYDALPASAKTSNSLFVITDATGADLSNYYTKSETSGATEISTALGNKQDTLVSGTNIKTINNESILGEGNITIEGGSSVNVVQTTGTSTTDVMSQSAATSNFIYGINLNYMLNGRKTLALQSKDKNLFIPYMTINGEKVLSTNDLSVIEASAITTSITSANTNTQVPSAKAVYDQLGGLKLVKLTQAQYDALSPNYDSNTLYIINE